MAMGFGIFMALFWLFFIAVAIGGFVLWIVMLIDAVKREYPHENDKLLWVLVIVFAGLIGAVIYYFVVKAEDGHAKKR